MRKQFPIIIISMSAKNLIVLFLAAFLLASCSKKPEQSPAYREARQLYLKVCSDLTFNCPYDSSEVDKILSLLSKVDPASSDYSAARDLRNRLMEKRKQMLSEKKDEPSFKNAEEATAGTSSGTAKQDGGDGYFISAQALQRQTDLPDLQILPETYEGIDLLGLFRKTGVRILIPYRDMKFGIYSCKAPEESVLKDYVPAVVHHISIYPKCFFKAGNIKSIMLCSDLYQGSNRPGGIPNAISGVLVMDTSYYRPATEFGSGLHHELYHIIDYCIDRSFADAKWQALNVSGFSYGSGGRASRSASTAFGSGEAGFITQYAMSGIEEDKAETFRFLIMQHSKTMQRAEADVVLKRKVDFIKTELAGLCPEMDQAFWRDRL